MTRRRRFARLAGVVVALLVASTAVAPSSTAQEDATGTFSGTASADAVRVNVAVPNYLLIEDFVDGGGPSAQAVLDSLGASRAFSSFPYPGELGVSATGLVSTLTGFSLPSYPLIATSDFPVQPERNIDQPGLHLNATSATDRSAANAAFGETTDSQAVEGGGFADASVDVEDDGTVVSRSEARFSIALGPVSFRGVRAAARIERAPDGTLERSSTLEVAGFSIGGVELGVTDRGVVVAGAPLVPIDVITGLTESLSLGTTKVRFLPADETDDSVLSAGLEVTTSITIPAVDRPLNVTYRLGNVFAQASGSAFDSDAVPTLPLGDEQLPSVDPGVTPTFDAPAVDLPSPSGPVVNGQPTATRRRVGDLVRASPWTFFPVLALAAVALFAGIFGERWQHSRDSTRGGSRWSS